MERWRVDRDERKKRTKKSEYTKHMYKNFQITKSIKRKNIVIYSINKIKTRHYLNTFNEVKPP